MRLFKLSSLLLSATIFTAAAHYLKENHWEDTLFPLIYGVDHAFYQEKQKTLQELRQTPEQIDQFIALTSDVPVKMRGGQTEEDGWTVNLPEPVSQDDYQASLLDCLGQKVTQRVIKGVRLVDIECDDFVTIGRFDNSLTEITVTSAQDLQGTPLPLKTDEITSYRIALSMDDSIAAVDRFQADVSYQYASLQSFKIKPSDTAFRQGDIHLEAITFEDGMTFNGDLPEALNFTFYAINHAGDIYEASGSGSVTLLSDKDRLALEAIKVRANEAIQKLENDEFFDQAALEGYLETDFQQEGDQKRYWIGFPVDEIKEVIVQYRAPSESFTASVTIKPQAPSQPEIAESQEGQSGLISPQGAWLVKPHYSHLWATDFDGLYRVGRDDDASVNSMAFDSEGGEAIEYSFEPKKYPNIVSLPVKVNEYRTRYDDGVYDYQQAQFLLEPAEENNIKVDTHCNAREEDCSGATAFIVNQGGGGEIFLASDLTLLYRSKDAEKLRINLPTITPYNPQHGYFIINEDDKQKLFYFDDKKETLQAIKPKIESQFVRYDDEGGLFRFSAKSHDKASYYSIEKKKWLFREVDSMWFDEPYYYVEYLNGDVTILDEQFNVIKKLDQYKDIYFTRGSMIRVLCDNNKYAFLNDDGSPVTDCLYAGASVFTFDSDVNMLLSRVTKRLDKKNFLVYYITKKGEDFYHDGELYKSYKERWTAPRGHDNAACLLDYKLRKKCHYRKLKPGEEEEMEHELIVIE